MPIWMQYVLGVAALLTALGVIWTKAIKPTLAALQLAIEVLPLLKPLATEFKDSPHAFKVLDEIVTQFRTNEGSSLRDVVNRLEAAAIENKNVADENRLMAESLKVGVEASRILAERDREQVTSLVIGLDRLSVKVDNGEAVRDRTAMLVEKIAAVISVQPPIQGSTVSDE